MYNTELATDLARAPDTLLFGPGRLPRTNHTLHVPNS